MLIRFTKDARHPHKRNYGIDAFGNQVFEFYAGKVYDLPDDEARWHIREGEAVGLAKIQLKAKQAPTITGMALVKKPNQNQDKQLKNLHKLLGTATQAKISLVKKPSQEQSNTFKALNIKPQRGGSIGLPSLNINELEHITSKKWGREVVNYLRANKDISASDIGEMLLSVLDYAIDNKDGQTISRVTRDLAVVYKLVRAKRAGNDK